MTAPLWVFGAGGQLGQELLSQGERNQIGVVGVTRAEADITDAAAVEEAIVRFSPRLVVNAAAYTAVDKAESEPDLACSINAGGAHTVASAAARAGIPVVHISTDFVFDGTKSEPYLEDDEIAPLSAYGRTKAEGEKFVRTAAAKHVIVRTAWVYSIYGSNFLKTMVRVVQQRDELRVVADQRGCPTATADLALAIFAIAASLPDCKWGTYHFAGTGATTWHGFAAEIVNEQAKFTGRRPAVTAIQSADWPSPARRPENSVLDSSRFTETFGYRAAPWKERVAEAIAGLFPEAQRASATRDQR